MPCIYPPPLADDQISAVLDGEAEPTILQHLASCPYCAVRFEQARTVENMLRHKLYRWNCPTPQQLADYHWQMLPPDESARVAEHVRECEGCREELDELSVFLAAENEPVVQRPQAPSSRPRLLRPGELIARLLPSSPAMVMRGESSGPVMAQADGITVFLEVQTSQHQQALAGQLVAEENQAAWTGALVELSREGEMQMTALLDEMGGFRCEPFVRGLVELRFVSSGGRSVVLPPMDL